MIQVYLVTCNVWKLVQNVTRLYFQQIAIFRDCSPPLLFALYSFIEGNVINAVIEAFHASFIMEGLASRQSQGPWSCESKFMGIVNVQLSNLSLRPWIMRIALNHAV